MSETKDFGTFEEFWPYYVRAHSNRTNRKLHFIGTSLGMASALGGILLRRKALLLLAPVFGYAFAWVGHFGFEKNTPASFSHPFWSFRADFVMWKKILDGTMDAEVERFLAEDLPSHETATANGATTAGATN